MYNFLMYLLAAEISSLSNFGENNFIILFHIYHSKLFRLIERFISKFIFSINLYLFSHIFVTRPNVMENGASGPTELPQFNMFFNE